MKLTVTDSPKMLRETLSVAQLYVGQAAHAERQREHLARLQRLIDECERHRPLGPDGKHDDRHTRTCGCDRNHRGLLRWLRRWWRRLR